MTDSVRTIAVCNDFLRDEPNQLDNTTANRDWLAAMVRLLAGPGFRVRELGNDKPAERRLDTADCMRALDLPCGPAGWAAAWDGEPTDRFVELLASRLEGTDLVVGFGLPNVVVRSLERLGAEFLDFEVSPLRFGRTLELDARTNIPALAGCPAWRLPMERFSVAAVDLVGWAVRLCPDTIPADAGPVGVIFGQTELDAALLHGGRVTDYSEFVPPIREWADGLEHVLFRPHPYATGTRSFGQLRDILPHVRPTLINSYQLLASQRLDRVLALSSGIIDEAAFFRIPATRLFMPKRRSVGFHYSIAASLNLLHGQVLAAVLDGASPPPVAILEYDLRKQFRIAWGLADTPVASDFHKPPSLEPVPPAIGKTQQPQPHGQPQTVEPQPQVLPPGPPPKAETPPAARPLQPIGPVPPTIPLRPSRRRPKLRHRLRSLARRVAGLVLPGKGPHVRPQPAASPPSVPARLATADSKDFSYGSGERQTAHDYGQIRRDHRVRYELAHRLLPPEIGVLDLFCGNGYGSFLLSENREVLGIDGSQPAIEVADRCFKRPGARFMARCYPFEDGREYDAIVSYESIEHVPDGRGFFDFLVRHLRPGGWMIYSTPNEDLLPFDRGVFIHHHRHYTHDDTLEFARSGGLTVESWFGQDVYETVPGGRPTLLGEERMELQPGTRGQFTVVVARKPGSRAA